MILITLKWKRSRLTVLCRPLWKPWLILFISLKIGTSSLQIHYLLPWPFCTLQSSWWNPSQSDYMPCLLWWFSGPLVGIQTLLWSMEKQQIRCSVVWVCNVVKKKIVLSHFPLFQLPKKAFFFSMFRTGAITKWRVAPYKVIKDKHGFWIPPRRFWIGF